MTTTRTGNKINFPNFYIPQRLYWLYLSAPSTTPHNEEKMGTPGNVFPPSTMKLLPDTYFDESWIKYLINDVNAGFDERNFLKGTVLKATLSSQSFCIRFSVISDLKSPGLIEFTLILSTPSSTAKICNMIKTRKQRKWNTLIAKSIEVCSVYLIKVARYFRINFCQTEHCWGCN